MTYKCKVCNYDGLYDPPYDERGIASEEICPCCGFHYGYDEDSETEDINVLWRKRWIEEGYKWFSTSRPAPNGWDAKEQLKELV